MEKQGAVLLQDTRGKASYMVKIPCFLLSDVIPGAPDCVHPAFVVNGRQVDAIYISKYQNTVVDGLAYSLPNVEPQTDTTLAQAAQVCAAKGAGWHLMTNAEWGAIALWCKAHSTQPHGNTDHGVCFTDKQEAGIAASGGRVLTGTGPAAWAHDGTPDGIYDLCGNVWEWVAGLRLVNGQIQLIENNDAAVGDLTWKTALCLDADGEEPVLRSERKHPMHTADDESFGPCAGCAFGALRVEDGIEVPLALQAGAVVPGADRTETGSIWFRNYGVRGAARGGSFSSEDGGGIFSLSFLDPVDCANGLIGFRAAYVEL